MRKLSIVLSIIGLLLPPSSAFSEEMLDYGALWKAWGFAGQTAYLWGFVDGSGGAMYNVFDEIQSSKNRGLSIPKDFYENIRMKTATLFDGDKLRDVMTNLYNNPANSYIWFQDMVYIARDSLKGNDISGALLKARKQAIANYYYYVKY